MYRPILYMKFLNLHKKFRTHKWNDIEAMMEGRHVETFLVVHTTHTFRTLDSL